jgi:hypothetical protein
LTIRDCFDAIFLNVTVDHTHALQAWPFRFHPWGCRRYDVFAFLVTPI